MTDDREHERYVVDKMVEYRAHGVSTQVTLYNLSTSGCMIEAPCRLATAGDDMVLKLNASIIVSGRVIWHAGRNAGIRFNENLHEAVVRHLGFQPKAHNFEAAWLVDRFGRPLPPLASLR